MAKANATIVDIDSNGDVLMQDFMESTKLRVSSKVLAQASDIFKIMMDHCEQSIRAHITISQLAHGQREKDNGEYLYALPVPLPGISKEASILFFNVLHHQTKELPQKLSLEFVLDIGFICHMFHCADALKPWSAMWLTRSEPEAAEDLEQSCKLLVTAHIFDDADSFSRISGTILLEKDGSFSTLPTPNRKLYFPWSSVLMEFELRKAEVTLSLVDAIESPIAGLMEHTPCTSTSQLVGKYLSDLKSCHLWPLGKELPQESISIIFTRMLSIPEPKKTTCGKDHCDSCSLVQNLNFREVLRDKKEKISNKLRGLCLDGVKTARGSLELDGCRFEHFEANEADENDTIS